MSEKWEHLKGPLQMQGLFHVNVLIKLPIVRVVWYRDRRSLSGPQFSRLEASGRRKVP